MSSLMRTTNGGLRFIPRHKFKLSAAILIPSYISYVYRKVLTEGNRNDIAHQAGMSMPDQMNKNYNADSEDRVSKMTSF